MDYVNIGGEKRPVKFGFRAMFEIRGLLGLTEENFIDSEEKTDPGLYALAVVFAGLKYGALREKKDFPFTMDDIEDWVDEDYEGATEILNIHNKVTLSQVKEESKKKEVKGAEAL